MTPVSSCGIAGKELPARNIPKPFRGNNDDFATDRAKNEIQDENIIPSDQKPQTSTAKQLEDDRTVSESQRWEGEPVSRA